MCDDVNSNPFAGLFSDVNEAISFSSLHTSEDDYSTIEEIKEDSQRRPQNSPLDGILRDVFGITIKAENDEKTKKYLVQIDADCAEQAIFERLIIDDLKSRLTPASGKKGWTCDPHTLLNKVVPYLFESFCRLRRFDRNESNKELLDNLEKITLRNVGTALQEPYIFSGQKVHEQFVRLFEDGSSVDDELSSFVVGMVNEIADDNVDENLNEESITAAFSPILDVLHEETKTCNLLSFRRYWFDLLQKFASVEALGKLIIRHSEPKKSNIVRSYSNTLLGTLLGLSCVSKNKYGTYDFFDKPLQQTRLLTEGSIWTALDALSESLHLVFHSLLKLSLEMRHLTLRWLGDCLDANANRGKLWHIENEMSGTDALVSDGFMLNLGTVMLKLCQPFCGKSNESKALKIDPTYCALEVKNDEMSRNRGMHLQRIHSETCLVPITEGEIRKCSENFGFVTECFFLTHRALDLGYRVVLEKFLRTNQDLARIQRHYNEIQTNESAGSSTLRLIANQMELETTKYMSLRASLLEPELLNLLAKFHATTAFWLIQVNIDVEDEITSENSVERQSWALRKFVNVKFPLPKIIPNTLKCIPEFVVENTIGFVCSLRRLSPNTFEEQGPSFLHPILTEIIALMGSPERLHNPHLRARLAEGLEALLPLNDEGSNHMQTSLGTIHREMLFIEHPHRHQIVANLLQVFVGIEMTGQNVQFEQKFNYRRPMYIVMDYLWKIDEHRNNFRNLAEEAEKNMEATQPPLFLRFINLLMNDAVFLLDEALTNMAQLKQMLQARENGEWNKLPPQERGQQASYLQHIGMIARFDNILGRETINMLKMLTTEIKSIFCHSTMVDRIASMLNYLLLQLVGPKQRDLKVKDQKEYEFNPANLVLNICEIYINLSWNENFTLAVSQDGRSYSPELFDLADNVLVRIGGVGILGDIDSFAKRVKAAAHSKQEEDEILTNAPDDFLDPIMSTLMNDPVVLPSSKITVDRQTIARHLLSDQTDPFNRSPLTMDMVQSNTELRNQIEEWVRQKKQEKSLSSETQC